MAEEWYYARQGEEFGPVSAGRLKQLAAAGQLQPTDLVWKIGMEKKVHARAIKGLFGNGSGAGTDSRIPPPPSRRANKEDIVPVEPMDEDEADADDRPRRKTAKKKGGLPVWLWVVLGGGFFLCCCVGVPGGGWFAYNSVMGRPRFNTENFKKVEVGMSQKEVEAKIGPPTKVVQNPEGGKEAVKVLEWDDGLGMKMTLTFVNDKLQAKPPLLDFKDLDFKDFKGKEFK